jgi:cytochrome c oxidase subunit 2
MVGPDFLRMPPEGSTLAGEVDDLYWFAVVVAAFFSLLIAGLIFYLGLKYRRKHASQRGAPPDTGPGPLALEITWSVIPLSIMLFLFYWGARVYLAQSRPPADADEYFVTGRQWMWKVQHPDGPREINELHAPVGRAIRLTMISEDVIHSFYVPAFRIKQDVLPNRYTTTWFRATQPGVYHLFCAEYCGTAHSGMVGRIIIMDPFEYEAWLAGGRTSSAEAPRSGEDVFNARGCPTCHRPDSAARGPILNGLAGSTVQLADGSAVTADDTYIRESILRPAAKVVAGYQPIMPAFEGQIPEDEMILLVTYIRSLKGPAGGAPAGGGGEKR